MEEKKLKAYAERAEEIYVGFCSNSRIQLDDEPAVVESEYGAFVQAWLWVPSSELEDEC